MESMGTTGEKVGSLRRCAGLCAALMVALATCTTPLHAQESGELSAAQFQRHQRPVPGGVIRPADIPENNWSPGHRGVDLAAAPGERVVASASGQVHFAGVVAGTPLVSVDHGDGMRTTYEPVLASVEVGEQVVGGDVLGVLADIDELPPEARREEGLSWGARVGERYLDPMGLLAPVRVRLWA